MTGTAQRHRALSAATRIRAALVCVLLLGIVSVEAGWRSPADADVEIRSPRALEPAIERLRAAPFQHIAHEPAAAVVSGVVLGRTDQIPERDRERFLRSGLWHLLAASGQNVALVCGLCLCVCWLCGGSRWHGVLLALVMVPAYVAVVGGGPSIVRAGIMGELALLAWAAGRLQDAWHAMLLAAATIVIVAPGSHRLLGFQLSFACVAALIAWCAPAADRLAAAGLPNWLASGVAASLLCSAATAPLLVLRTGEAPLAGALTNLMAVPTAAVMLLVGLPSVICAAADVPFGHSGLQLAGLLAQLLRVLAAAGAQLPLASTGSLTLACTLPAVVALALGPREQFRSRAPAVVLAMMATALLVWGWQRYVAIEAERPPPGTLRIAALDVGQGDATLLDLDRQAILVDVGPPRSGVVRRTRELGVRRVHGIVVTHDSADHRGALREAVRGLRPAWVAIPAHAPGEWGWVRGLGVPVSELCAGRELRIARARLEVLHPDCNRSLPALTGDLSNDNAIVLLARLGSVTALLSSDAEAPVMQLLDLPPRLHLLRVAHHGSEDPQLAALLRRTSPASAVISVGEDNPYDHPRPETLAALRAARIPTWRTDEHGTVLFETDGRRLWQASLR